MKIKNNIKNFEVLRNVLIVGTMFNEKTLIRCTMLKRQRTRYSLTFKIRFKHGSNTSIIYYTSESKELLTDETISDIYIKLIEMFNDLENASTIFVVIHNVLLHASTYMDGGSGLLDFIIGFMEDINK